MQCKKDDKGRMCGASWRNSVFRLEAGTATKVSVETYLTYNERMVFLVWVQWKLTLITEAQYTAELTRLGYTTASANALLGSKGEGLAQFNADFKMSIWTSFRDMLYLIEGFTTDLEKQVETIVMGEGQIETMEERVEAFLKTKLEMSEKTLVAFRYDFQYSIYIGVQKIFKIKSTDIMTVPKPHPNDNVPAAADDGTAGTTTTVDVETEFTEVERQVIFFWIEFEM